VVAVLSRRTLKSVWFDVKKLELESYLRDLLRADDERRRRKKRQKTNSERSLLICHPQQPNWRHGIHAALATYHGRMELTSLTAHPKQSVGRVR